jgi:hypothetical protein
LEDFSILTCSTRAKLWRSTTSSAADPSIDPSPPGMEKDDTPTPLLLPDYPTQEGD